MIDDEVDASGEGVLEAAGLEQSPQEPVQAREEQPALDAEPEKRSKRDKLPESDLQVWWRRYQRYREERRRRHVPGVWVVYFSLAALPLYGLGQALIPAGEIERRRYAFWLMSIYVASGLGLLLTTSFLGLRRYLRQKKVQMPIAMTGVWLLLGAALIACFLVLGALLPRPAAEFAIIDLPWRAGAKEREASRFAQHGDDAGKDEGRAGKKGKGEPEPGAKDDAAGKNQGDKGKGERSASSQKDQGSNGGAKGKDKGDQKDKGASQGKKGGADEKDHARKGDHAKEHGKTAPERQGQADPPPPNAGPSAPSEWITRLVAILKWIVLGAFILVIAFFILRGVLQFLANFTGWARSLLDFFGRWWQRLGAARGPGESSPDASAAQAKPAPFQTFGDPFHSGQAARMSPADLVRYTFEALEAWAADRNLARDAGETPLEFAERLGEEVPALDEGARQLAGYYAGLAYAGQALTDDCREPLRQLWQLLAATARRNAAPRPQESYATPR